MPYKKGLYPTIATAIKKSPLLAKFATLKKRRDLSHLKRTPTTRVEHHLDSIGVLALYAGEESYAQRN